MVRSTSCQRSRDSASGRRIERPALLTRMSTPPKRCSTTAASSSTASRSDRSQGSAVEVPPAPAMRSDNASSRSARRATAITSAPAAAKHSAPASPIPEDAPVISTRLPRSEIRVPLGIRSGGRIPAIAIASVSLRRSGVTWPSLWMLRSSGGTGCNPGRASRGRHRGPRRPRRSYRPAGWPHRRRSADPPGRHRGG